MGQIEDAAKDGKKKALKSVKIFLTKTQAKAAYQLAIGVPPKMLCAGLHVTTTLLAAWQRMSAFRLSIKTLKENGFSDEERFYFKRRRAWRDGKLVRC